MLRYDLIYTASMPVLAPYLLWRRLKKGKYTQSAGGMLGRRLPPLKSDAAPAGSLWLHAVSVGEVAAARAVAPHLRTALGPRPLVVSTITETGQAAARAAFGDDTVIYFPLDISPIVAKFQQTYRPEIFITMETEIWPNFLTRAAARGARCYMLNAKLSDRSYPRYLRFRAVLAPALAALRGVCAQTQQDAERFQTLGIPHSRIEVMGNCKFDLSVEPLNADQRQALARELGMNPRRRWIVAGSTHEGEEELILAAFRQIKDRHPQAGLLLCPRHPERFDRVAQLARRGPWRVGRASQAGQVDDPEVVILDRMGVLARAYGLGDVAVVAGSFGKVGGHNLLEAAAHAVPVIHGPRMHSQREIRRLMQQADAGTPVEPGELAPTINRFFEDDARRRVAGEKARRVVELNQGSARRASEAIQRWESQKP